uniref:peptidylprolyl isomerase n=1 Tax=Fibrocapsa japonica TaxID=94617 RepID=A0A7S2Y0A7_9STRA|mmetsp:Transcript_7842/g.11952  ORF Transcript_7842/g.11952 Transcript_7842/m.11952 type:complete len:186 (+) Transcript_7842:59-616(+)|eukprot:CAMPEP_0113941714 /NCGR_PEP_ID=MMETSP1339-20121228/7576_1 /TAXON_ID=94617 /ORGANISM="Fibrocapsa japonica" /LENGTH=185 /DNA_ID=CAMNT_0000945935 /DNA_START=50 /DNA_END=607 /DNA_ORIENTATION=+ /assembly_acc=CAM_ASM_000762
MKFHFSVLILIASLLRCHSATNSEGLKYLEENRLKEDVVETSSGLQYKVIEAGDASSTRPNRYTQCVVHYEGRTIDGQVFDSSYKRGDPATFYPHQRLAVTASAAFEVIDGWTEALEMMNEGSKWEVTIPSELAYHNQAIGDLITPGSVLVYTLELLDVISRREMKGGSFKKGMPKQMHSWYYQG